MLERWSGGKGNSMADAVVPPPTLKGSCGGHLHSPGRGCAPCIPTLRTVGKGWQLAPILSLERSCGGCLDCQRGRVYNEHRILAAQEFSLPASALRLALKEWAVTVKAMDEGQQILLLRKGGIREEAKEFRLLHPRFLLYPSYEHQQESLLQPAFHRALAATFRERPEEGFALFTHWGEVTESFDIMEEERVAALTPLHIWTAEYAAKRLHWRPRKPLMAMLVRLYRLPSARLVPVLPRYAGCTSWVELEDEISVEGSVPAVSESRFVEQSEAARRILRTSMSPTTAEVAG